MRSRQVVGIVIVLVNEMLREFVGGWMAGYVRVSTLGVAVVYYSDTAAFCPARRPSISAST